MDPFTQQLAPKIRKRVPKACDHCRKRKIRCGVVNSTTGMCDNCVKFGVPCTFKHHHEMERQRLVQGFDLEKPRVSNGGVKKPRKNSDSFSKPDLNTLSETANPNSPLQTLENKLEALESQIGVLLKLLTNQNSTSSSKFQDQTASFQSAEQRRDAQLPGLLDVSPYPKPKRYKSSLITKRRIAWLRNRAKLCYGQNQTNPVPGAEVPVITSFTPLMDVFVVSSKWYVAEVKKLIDYSNPFVPVTGSQLYPLPPQQVVQKMVQLCDYRIFQGALSIVGYSELDTIVSRCYAGEKLSYSELLLIDIWICVCTAYDVSGTDDYYLKQPSSEMHIRESHMLLNSMYQYHKVSLISEGFRSVQALLLLYQYVQTKISANVAYSIFCVAQRYAQDVGLHKRKTYEGLSFEESWLKLKMWYMCVTIDAHLSLAFCRAPLINIEESDVFTEAFYADFIKCHDLARNATTEMEPSDHGSLKHSISILLTSPDTLLIGGCYYGIQLSQISGRIYRDLLGPDVMSKNTFDAVLRRALSILNDLKEWEKSLPEELSLEYYEKHIENLHHSHQNPDLEITDVHLGILSTSVLSFHFERLYLTILVCQMMSSFITDNTDIHSRSAFNVELLQQRALKDLRSSAMQLISIWPRIKFVPHMLQRMFYILSVGAYGLLLTSIGLAQEEDTAKYIAALCDVYTYLCDEGDSKLLIDNIKWNVSMFIYTFLLTLAIQCFNSMCPQASNYNFTTDSITNKFPFWMDRCEQNKVVAVNQLREHLNIFAPSVDLPDGAENDDLALERMRKESDFPRAFHLFSEVNVGDFKCLLSSLPIQIVSRDTAASSTAPQGVEDKGAPANFSQEMPEVGTGLLNGFDGAFGLDFSPNDFNQVSGATFSSDQTEFENALDNLLFERDFAFPAMM
ncbi:LAFA_0F02960g1_1 [Lachancea sp. 'fantastica']|nr:LAFA_0F02960g1_1 [Lachancea sp. 'fantastica']